MSSTAGIMSSSRQVKALLAEGSILLIDKAYFINRLNTQARCCSNNVTHTLFLLLS
jgi:hypothetical protein